VTSGAEVLRALRLTRRTPRLHDLPRRAPRLASTGARTRTDHAALRAATHNSTIDCPFLLHGVASLRTRLERISEWLQRRVTWWLGAISSFFVYDIVRDSSGGEFDAHVLIEAVIFAICTALLVVELQRNRRLRGRLEEAQARNRRLSGEFSGYVVARLAGWGLSRSEQEIAWLTLKGYSFTEIASLRSVSETHCTAEARSNAACRAPVAPMAALPWAAANWLIAAAESAAAAQAAEAVADRPAA